MLNVKSEKLKALLAHRYGAIPFNFQLSTFNFLYGAIPFNF